MSPAERYYLRFAAAFVRGKATQGDLTEVPERLLAPGLDELIESELTELFDLGAAAGLKLHKFKRALELPRVRQVLGVLRGLGPAELLDIGSGRGVFLWPLLDAFPDTPVTTIDRDSQRASDLEAVRLGGVARLSVSYMDVTALKLADSSHDVVTLLEVLEHIPQAQQALNETVRVARRFVVLSVPSHEDDNPEHLHLFTETALRRMFAKAGVRRVSCTYVPGHLVAVAKVGVP